MAIVSIDFACDAGGPVLCVGQTHKVTVLLEVRIEGEGRIHTETLHYRKGCAVGEAEPLIGVPSEDRPSQRFIRGGHVHKPGDFLGPDLASDANRQSVTEAPQGKSGDLVQDIRAGYQRNARLLNKPRSGGMVSIFPV